MRVCVCDKVVCVCDKVACERLRVKVVCDKVVCERLCVTKLRATKMCVRKVVCVCHKLVCDKVVFDKVGCERVCVTKVVCERLTAEGAEAEERAAWIQNPKQEPHTKMWETIIFLLRFVRKDCR